MERLLLTGPEDFYKKHLNSDLLTVNFTDLTDKQFYTALKRANLQLLGNYYRQLYNNMERKTIELYDNLDVNFRGYRHT